MIKKILNLVPKLDPIVAKVTTNAKERKIAKLVVRVVQIGAVVFLLYKGLIDSEQAIEIIKD